MKLVWRHNFITKWLQSNKLQLYHNLLMTHLPGTCRRRRGYTVRCRPDTPPRRCTVRRAGSWARTGRPCRSTDADICRLAGYSRSLQRDSDRPANTVRPADRPPSDRKLHTRNQTGSILRQVFVKGKARTQSPTIRNCAPELPGVAAGVSPTEVQWQGLTLGEPPS